jgi:hypothetical protein
LLYLLDADTIITGDRDAYPLRRFPIFWEWLLYVGSEGMIKIPIEQYEEITNGKGPIVDWCNDSATRAALVFAEEASRELVARVAREGYAADLTEDEVEQIGRDPFLISYGAAAMGLRTVVTFETSRPAARRANRKVPDVCATLGVPCCTLFQMIKDLDFTTDWKP